MTAPLKILIVDDDPMMAKTLSDILELWGCETTTANSGIEALDRVAHATFDCLFSDIRMPGMNGVELHSAIGSQNSKLPTALMTAYSETKLVQQGIDAGVVAVFTKPLDMDLLFQFLRALPDQLNDFVSSVGYNSLGKIFTKRSFSPDPTTDGDPTTSTRHP